MPVRFCSPHAPGGCLVAVEKHGRTADDAVVQATVGETLRLANPWPESEVRGVVGAGEKEPHE